MARQDVAVTIGAQPDLTPGLAQASAELEAWGKKSGHAAAPISGHLREIKGDMVSSMRAANALARGFNDIVPAASAAGEGIRLGLSALMMGTAPIAAIAFALEATIAGVKLLAEAWHEAANEAKKFADDAEKAIDALDQRIEGLRNKTGAEKGQAEFLANRMRRGDLEAQIEELRSQADAEKAFPASLRNDTLIRQNEKLIEEYEAQIGQLDRRAGKLSEIVQLEIRNALHAKEVEVAEKRAADATKARANQLVAMWMARDKGLSLEQIESQLGAGHLWGQVGGPVGKPPSSWDVRSMGLPFYGDTAEGYADAFSRVEIANAQTEESINNLANSYTNAKDDMRSFAEAGASGFFDLARAAGQGTDAVVAAFQRMLDQLLSMMQRLAMDSVFQSLFPKAVGPGEVGGAGPVSAPVMEPMGVTSVAQASTIRRVENHYHINGDVLDADGWFGKHEGALSRRVRALAYKGAI